VVHNEYGRKGEGRGISPQRHKGTKRNLQGLAAGAALEVFEVVCEFRAEIFIEGIGTVFDETGRWRAKLA